MYPVFAFLRATIHLRARRHSLRASRLRRWPMPATAFNQPVTVEIEGVAPPAYFANLEAAVAAIWRSLRELPLGWNQYDAYRDFFDTEGAVDRVQSFLERDRELTLSFTMAGEPHAIRIIPAMPR